MSENKGKGVSIIKLSENTVIADVGGAEIFRLTFNPQNFAENYHNFFPRHNPEKLKADMEALLAQSKNEPGEEVNRPSFQAAIQKAGVAVIGQFMGEHIAERITEKIDHILVAVIDEAIRAYAIEWLVDANKETGQKAPLGNYKDEVLKSYWNRIRYLTGIKRGGPRKRKGFVWTNKEKIALYEKVESLPKYKNKSAWQFLLDELIEQEFDAEAIIWLKSSPVLKDVSEELINEAIKTWRKYLGDEKWSEMKPKDKPRGFEFRHALRLLNYPDGFAYSTLETYYYEGKKLSDKQT